VVRHARETNTHTREMNTHAREMNTHAREMNTYSREMNARRRVARPGTREFGSRNPCGPNQPVKPARDTFRRCRGALLARLALAWLEC
jgi:hypothetical protein